MIAILFFLLFPSLDKVSDLLSEYQWFYDLTYIVNRVGGAETREVVKGR